MLYGGHIARNCPKTLLFLHGKIYVVVGTLNSPQTCRYIFIIQNNEDVMYY